MIIEKIHPLHDIGKLSVSYIDKFVTLFTDYWNRHDSGIFVWNKIKTNVFSTTTSSVTTNSTLDDTSEMILVDSSSGALTITLPTASGVSGKRYHIKVTAGTNLVTIDGDGSETVEGNARFWLPGEGFAIELVSDGSNWRTL